MSQTFFIVLISAWIANRDLQVHFETQEKLEGEAELLEQSLEKTKTELTYEKTTAREQAILEEYLYGSLKACQIPPEELLLEARPISAGANGVVCRAWYNGTQVVVKKLPRRFLSDPDQIKLFRDEIIFQMHMRHPHIVQLIGASWNVGNTFIGIVMEYMHRGTLAPIINDDIVPLEWYGGLGSSMALDVALGMAYLHQRKVRHNDLKSDNMLVSEYWRCKLGDFGECRSEEHASLKKGECATTPLWAAPEVLRCEQPTNKVDVWSYGIVIVELVNRTLPFAEEVRTYWGESRWNRACCVWVAPRYCVVFCCAVLCVCVIFSPLS